MFDCAHDELLLALENGDKTQRCYNSNLDMLQWQSKGVLRVILTVSYKYSAVLF